jgi:outer membrane protein assembly factor BamB
MIGKICKLISALFFVLALLAAAARAAADDQAAQIIRAAGIKGGLIVQLGCGDGRLTAALHAGDGYLVHGLDADANSVEAARRHIQSLGLYGKVSVAQWTGKQLPYVDNLVNLLVISGANPGITDQEVQRVLAPQGAAIWFDPKSKIQNRTITKPRPEQIDEWTHFLHGADNNAVARDTVIDSPQHIQWIGEPGHSRSHQFLTSISAMVSAGGRLFYIADEGPTWLHDFLPAQWSLCARDAFNGVVLWKRQITSWQPAGQRGRIPFPPDLFRRLVAVGERVYTTLSIFGPVAALDAATGETIRTYAGTDKAEEIICDRGVLFCVAALQDPDSIDRRAMTYQRTQPVQKRIMAIRAETGQLLWTKEDADTFGYMPLTLVAQGSRALFQNPEAVVCLDAQTGKPLWRHEQKSTYAREAWSTPTLVIVDDVVLSADRPAGDRRGKAGSAQLVALAADTGKELWRCDCVEGHTSSPEVLVANGLVWVGENPAHKQLDFRTARDLHTGEVRKQFGPTEGWATWHHHRCYREKATTRYLLTSRTGVEFTDMESGQLTPHHWIRGICRYGVLPCNGLLYLPPDQCACYIESKLCGFNVLAPQSQASPPLRDLSDPARLERGPAYGTLAAGPSSLAPRDEWPTYRHDAARSGRTLSDIKPELKQRWCAELGGKLTSLVSAEGKVYVGQVDTHAVTCLDAETGRVLWRHTAGGRVDSPPTIAKGIAVFGCRDGYVYALRAADGKLIWRFQAAPDDRRLVAYGQLESVWPVHGSTLVEGDAVYAAAGRNSYFDGGVCLYKLDLTTGKTLLAKRCYSRDPNTGQRFDLFQPFRGEVLPDREMPGLLPDVFSADQHALYLRSVALGRDFELLGRGKPHLFCSVGFLEDASWERTYWLFGTHMYGGARGWGYAQTIEPAGRIMAFDDARVYGFEDATSRMGVGLYAAAKEPDRLGSSDAAKKGKKGKKAAKGEKAGKRQAAPAKEEDEDAAVPKAATFAYQWRKAVPLNVRAMVLSGDTLFVAGPERFDERATYAYLNATRTDEAKLPPLLADAMSSVEGKKGSLLWAVSDSDGKKLASCQLQSAPVFDGMIASGGRLYFSTLAGQVVCLGQ